MSALPFTSGGSDQQEGIPRESITGTVTMPSSVEGGSQELLPQGNHIGKGPAASLPYFALTTWCPSCRIHLQAAALKAFKLTTAAKHGGSLTASEVTGAGVQ